MRTTAKDNIIAWQFFAELAKNGSLTASSIALGLNLSVASKLIRELESDLGLDLFDRTCRPIELTDNGRRLLPRAKKFIAAHRFLCTPLQRADNVSAKRTIRLGISLNRTRSDILQIMREYAEIAPDVEIELVSGADAADVLEGRVDAACIAWRPPQQSELHVLNMGTCQNFMMASPAYLHAHGTPQCIEDLAGHTLLLKRESLYPTADKLYNGNDTFDLYTQIHTVENKGMLRRISPETVPPGRPSINLLYGDTLTCVTRVMEGEGIAVDLSCGLMQKLLLDQRLIPVLPDWHRALWDKTMVVRRTKYADKEICHFLHWYQKREMHASHARWSSVFDQLGIESGNRA